MGETRSEMPSAAASAARDTPAGFDGVVRKAFDDQKSLLGRAEHCSLDPHRLQAIGRVMGSQIRVGRPSEPDAIYTVSETRPESTATTLRMGRAGRERLDPDGPADAFEVHVEARVPHPEYSDAEARQHSEFVERLDDECRQGRLVILAPHGGSIEPGTDQQAERVRGCAGKGHRQCLAMQGVRDRRRLQALSHHVIRSARIQLPASGRDRVAQLSSRRCFPRLHCRGRTHWRRRPAVHQGEARAGSRRRARRGNPGAYREQFG